MSVAVGDEVTAITKAHPPAITTKEERDLQRLRKLTLKRKTEKEREKKKKQKRAEKRLKDKLYEVPTKSQRQRKVFKKQENFDLRP